MVSRYQQGAKLQEIANQSGITQQAVWYHLKKTGIPLRLRAVNLNPEEVIAAYKAGESIRELAKRLGCSTMPIRDMLYKTATPTRRIDYRIVGRQYPKRVATYNADGRRKSGRIIDWNGYVRILDPNHDGPGTPYWFEHRLVWEAAHSRQLLPNERVHHINGMKTDNRPENLVALTHGAHSRLHRKQEQATTTQVSNLQRGHG